MVREQFFEYAPGAVTVVDDHYKITHLILFQQVYFSKKLNEITDG